MTNMSPVMSLREFESSSYLPSHDLFSLTPLIIHHTAQHPVHYTHTSYYLLSLALYPIPHTTHHPSNYPPILTPSTILRHDHSSRSYDHTIKRHDHSSLYVLSSLHLAFLSPLTIPHTTHHTSHHSASPTSLAIPHTTRYPLYQPSCLTRLATPHTSYHLSHCPSSLVPLIILFVTHCPSHHPSSLTLPTIPHTTHPRAPPQQSRSRLGHQLPISKPTRPSGAKRTVAFLKPSSPFPFP